LLQHPIDVLSNEPMTGRKELPYRAVGAQIIWLNKIFLLNFLHFYLGCILNGHASFTHFILYFVRKMFLRFEESYYRNSLTEQLCPDFKIKNVCNL